MKSNGLYGEAIVRNHCEN